MKFNLSKEVARIGTSWNGVCYSGHSIREREEKHSFVLGGPKGCGKTKIAQEFVRSHAYAFYISFDKMTNEEALASFIHLYIPECSDINGWNDAVDAFMKKRSYKPTLVFFENEHNESIRKCSGRFLHYALKRNNVKICDIDTGTSYYNQLDVEVHHRTIADFYKAFPNYSKADVVRLYALTGGLLSVAKELDESANYEDNVRILLRYDSAFSTVLPTWLNACFRTPESYYPILKSMAAGRCHLSEIAKDVSFPNNKCLNYLEALIKNDFVVAEKLVGSKQATYHIANSYITAWCLYACGKTLYQVNEPDKLLELVTDDIDEYVAVPAFRDACIRYTENAWKDHLIDYRAANVLETKKAVTVKLRDGSETLLDYCVKTDYTSFYFIFPHTLGMKYTKEEMERIFEAIEKYDSLYNTSVVVFSLNRFSDWCVHEAAVHDWLHEVTMERLKY